MAKNITHKIGNTSFEVTITTPEDGGKQGLTGITVNGRKLDNFRTTDKGHRAGSALKGTYPEAHRTKFHMIEGRDGKGNLVWLYPLSMKSEAVVKAIVEYHLSGTVAKAEAKAEAKAKTEAAKVAKVEAKAKVAKTTPEAVAK